MPRTYPGNLLKCGDRRHGDSERAAPASAGRPHARRRPRCTIRGLLHPVSYRLHLSGPPWRSDRFSALVDPGAPGAEKISEFPRFESAAPCLRRLEPRLGSMVLRARWRWLTKTPYARLSVRSRFLHASEVFFPGPSRRGSSIERDILSDAFRSMLFTTPGPYSPMRLGGK